MSLKIWQEESQKVLADLIEEKPSREGAIFLNSLLGILSYLPEVAQMTAPTQETPTTAKIEAIDYVPHSRIDEEMQNSLQHFVDYMSEKSKFQTSGVQLHLSYAEKALEKMLKVDENIVIMLYNSADAEERKLIRASYQNILASLS